MAFEVVRVPIGAGRSFDGRLLTALLDADGLGGRLPSQGDRDGGMARR